MRFCILLPAVIAAGCATTTIERMSYRTVGSAAMGRPMEYGVYTPPAFDPREALPLFLFLHGGGDNAHCLDANDISGYLDGEILAGRVPRVVVLVPDGDTGFWANWADGTRHYQDWVLDEALPAAAREFHTQPCRDGCHVFGLSMGGNGALRMALARPETFASAGSFSGPILDARGMDKMVSSVVWGTFARLGRIFDIHDEETKRRNDPFQRWQSPEDLRGLKLYFAHGDHDRFNIAETNAAFAEHLKARGMPYRYIVYAGGHHWHEWQPLFGDFIRFSLGNASSSPAPSASSGSASCAMPARNRPDAKSSLVRQ